MHKKGITEEVAKKRSRKTVKHQRGIVGVGADLQSILAKKNQTEAMRTLARQQAIQKAKESKKDKEAKKAKSKVCDPFYFLGLFLMIVFVDCETDYNDCTKDLETAGQGCGRWKGGSLLGRSGWTSLVRSFPLL